MSLESWSPDKHPSRLRSSSSAFPSSSSSFLSWREYIGVSDISFCHPYLPCILRVLLYSTSSLYPVFNDHWSMKPPLSLRRIENPCYVRSLISHLQQHHSIVNFPFLFLCFPRDSRCPWFDRPDCMIMDHHTSSFSQDGSMMMGMKGSDGSGISTGRHLLMAVNASPFEEFFYSNSAIQTTVNATTQTILESFSF